MVKGVRSQNSTRTRTKRGWIDSASFIKMAPQSAFARAAPRNLKRLMPELEQIRCFLLSRMSRSSEGVQEPPVCEVDPLDIAGQAASCAISIELMG